MADRVKHQIVKFTNGRARVYITDDISSITEDETTLINPDMSYVRGVSPEFWTLKDGKLWPEEDPVKIDEINRNAAAISAPSDLKRIELAQQLDKLEDRVEDNYKELSQDLGSITANLGKAHNELAERTEEEFNALYKILDSFSKNELAKLKNDTERNSIYLQNSVILLGFSILVLGLVILLK